MAYRDIVTKLGSTTSGTVLTIIRSFVRSNYDLSFTDGRTKGNNGKRIVISEEVATYMKSHGCLRAWAVYSLPQRAELLH